jgi:hypothetical protein
LLRATPSIVLQARRVCKGCAFPMARVAPEAEWVAVVMAEMLQVEPVESVTRAAVWVAPKHHQARPAMATSMILGDCPRALVDAHVRWGRGIET